MAVRSLRKACYFILLVGVMSCLEPFEPRVNPSIFDLLVVDGFVNATDGTASVRLSHTQSLSETKDARHESGATVFIRSGSGRTIELTEQDSGTYAAKDMEVDLNTVYSLHIKTPSGTEYASDTVRFKKTPPIDNLSFGTSAEGENMTILVDTHDPLGKTRYYKWDYTETYEYHAAFYSAFHFRNGLLYFRKPDELVYKCWRTLPSTTISIGTSAGLTRDIISRNVLTYVPKTSPKLSVRYSILAKQMAISVEEYVYLQQLRNTTEGLGGIFGTLPSSVTGNIHQVGNTETIVLGYFGGAEVTEKRFFVDRDQLPPQLKAPPSRKGCVTEQTCGGPVPNVDPNVPLALGPPPCVLRSNVSSNVIVLYAEGEGYPPYFTFTSQACGDCTTQGGTTTKPPFW